MGLLHKIKQKETFTIISARNSSYKLEIVMESITNEY